jgi:23S rRNA (cytidine1920-2'-O)/16S rRNA (cytidine1409-2'-O)-methyltransferase
VKKRIDVLLVERGLAASRAQAQALVLAGLVPGYDKPGHQLSEDAELTVKQQPRFVSRGGEKLANALEQVELELDGRDCIDLGASTGGFTDALLQRGARHVVAVDVAYGELDWGLRNDDRVTVLERTNVRALNPADLPYAPDLLVADLSFISLRKVLPALLGCMAPAFDALVMVKPQFEVGRGRVGSGGVVRDPAERRWAIVAVATAAQELGASVLGFASSGLPGPKGNLETFAWLAEGGRSGAVDDVEPAAAEVEPT